MALPLIANTIRGLSMDGIHAANSGHPGKPMGMADVAAVLWTQYLKHNPETADLLMITTGSEVEITLAAAQKLGEEGKNVRVVSMPSWELFEKQDEACRGSVLPDACTKRIAVEAGTSLGWERYVGRHGVMVSKDDFGASAPFKVVRKSSALGLETSTKRRLHCWARLGDATHP
jgi:transketolase